MFFPCKIPVFCSVFYVCPLVLHVGIQNLHFFALSPPRFGLGAHEVIGDGHFQGVSRELDVAIPAKRGWVLLRRGLGFSDVEFWAHTALGARGTFLL